MQTRSASTTANAIILLVILAAIVLGTVAVLRIDTWGERRVGRWEDPDADPVAPEKIDPALIRYIQTAEIPVAMQEVRALAARPDDLLYVAGDRAIHLLGVDGTKYSEIALDGEPRCLAVGDGEHAHPGRIYVGMKDRVAVYDRQGKAIGTWDSLGEKALLTSIAVDEEDVFVADAGNRIVLRYSPDGELKNRIGERDDLRRIPGFMITSPCFDLAVAPDGLLRVVNPRALRIEAYTFRGNLEAFWGRSAPTIDGFFGCCNPVHLAVLSDGRCVTAEKGVSRVKVYDATGEFQCVVAGPEQLAVAGDEVLADLAVDSRDRVLVLDPKSKSVRVFEPKQADSGAQQ